MELNNFKYVNELNIKSSIHMLDIQLNVISSIG